MKAVIQNGYGAPGAVLSYGEAPTPTRVLDDVLGAVRAASLNAREWHLMRGDPYVARLTPGMSLRAPRGRVVGTDFAGTVVAVGTGVTDLKEGDDVYGEVDGAFAEYVRAPRRLVGVMPANLTHEQAAAVPLAGNTALECLRDEAKVVAGQRLLVNGASGGVGTFAVQIGRALGADVTGVCSTRNVDLVRSLGAGHVVDYAREDFVHSGRYDVVLDLVGNRSLKDLRRCVTDGGTLVLSGGGTSTGGSLVGPMGLFIRGSLAARFSRRHRILTPQPKPAREKFDALTALLEAGTVVPAIDRTYPLSAASDAIRYLEEEHARAKVVLTIGQSGTFRTPRVL
ncbi:NAD(P)-dependent alcohol dehydrogenase [Virgisporangium ochraceum]